MKKRLVSLLLVLMLLLPAVSFATDYFPLADTKTLSVLTSANSLGPQDKAKQLIYERLFASTNVTVDWTCYVDDQFVEKRNLALSRVNSMPDVVLNADMGILDLLRYAKQGVIIPVEDLIDQYMPNLSAVLEEAPSYRSLITAPDGHIYSFPWIEQLGVGKTAIQAIGGMPFINKTWLDELGLEMPTTTDEFVAVLEAFKENDPAGNGDTLPMGFIINGGNEDLGFILGAFGYGDNPDHTMVSNEGEVIYSAVQDGYKEGIAWLNSLQEKGLIDPESYTHNWESMAAKGNAGRYGVFFGWDNYGIPGSYSNEYVPLPALAGPTGIKNAVRGSGSADGGFQVGRAVITAACDDVELAARWIDQMYDPMFSIQANWGTYGEEGAANIFELNDEGMLVHLAIPEGISNWEARVAQMVGGPLAVLDSYYGVYSTCPPDALERMGYVESYVGDMIYDMVYPNVFYSQDDATRLYQIETDIQSYTNQKKADWILNGGVEAEWDAYLTQLDELGLSEYIAIKQKYLDAYLAQ